MNLNSSWKSNSSHVSREISHIFWNMKVHDCIHKSLPPVPILNQSSLVHASSFSFMEFHFKVIPHLRLGLLRGLFPTGLTTSKLNKYFKILFRLHPQEICAIE
jgi:hypothetical protein